jgi:hypothetical protein
MIRYVVAEHTFMSLADGQLRDQVQAAVAQSEQGRLARVAQAWEHTAGLIGYRLRPGLGATFETLATLIDATMRGLVLVALSMPDIAAHRAAASPSGAAGQEEWSLPAMGIASTASVFLEPDPAIEWDDDRIASVRQAPSGWAPPDA